MRDIEKLRRLLDLRSAFPENWDVIEPLSRGLNLQAAERERMERGFEAEDRFAAVFSPLAWTNLIHSLHQRQHPSASTKEFQVPDYLALLHAREVPSAAVTSLLIETKSVAREKETFEISREQLALLARYSDSISIPFVIAVLWRKLQMWTLHTPDQFEPKTNSLKLTMRGALANDLSIIFSDALFILESGWIRRTVYDPGAEGYHLRNGRLGYIVADEISSDGGITFTLLDEVQSGILNVMFHGELLELKEDSSKSTVTERNRITSATKLSSIINFLLEKFEAYEHEDGPEKACQTAVKFRNDLQLPHSPNVPRVLSPLALDLIQRVFGVVLEK